MTGSLSACFSRIVNDCVDVGDFLVVQEGDNPASSSWHHENPFHEVGDYDATKANGGILGAYLSLQLDEFVLDYTNTHVHFTDKNGVDHTLGNLVDAFQSFNGWFTFELDKNWLNGVAVETTLTFKDDSFWFYEDTFDDLGIEKSKLSVKYNPCKVVDNQPTPTIPAPGALLLGSLGTACVGCLRRRQTI